MVNKHPRLEAAREFIDLNLDSDLDVEGLSRVACLSKYHFHRQFSSFYGISVANYVRLLRLKKASYLLVYKPQMSVTEIALDCRYENSESFSRAFRRVFELSPSEFRVSPDWEKWGNHFEAIYRLRSDPKMNADDFDVSIIHFDSTDIAVIEHQGVPIQIGESVAKFREWRKSQNISYKQTRIFNIFYDNPDDLDDASLFRVDIGCLYEDKMDLSCGFIKKKTIPGGRFAKVRFVGSSDSIGMVVRYLYERWLPASGERLRDYPVTLERVSFFPFVPEPEAITDILLPIE
ncbi:AraC family transcriptional regulator [Enterovibrio sp. ZSDZ35]|uniref:AraC family transcriptional regulator n=1 Tax=Enterovibrio qingdaonensis TaxID=2899818 RepID=A0ABT5QFW5_9GAMM|nr:GyrI-like domain-containing protein [Enterovibrio sp. ZSDZ35]MDD1779878.1 AraC family transcriptional regulator [Enterovibrio sp. ZSDZ35]